MKYKNRLFIIIIFGFILILGCYFISNRPIDWKQPFGFFQPSTPESLTKYPIINDCRQDKHATLDNKKPSAAELNSILNTAAILQQFPLRKGYSFGRIRMETIGLPGPNICFTYYYLGIRNEETNTIRKGEDQLQAIVVKEKDLPIIGLLLYGEPNTNDYKRKYSEWITKKHCAGPSDVLDCVSYRLALPPLIDDGQMTQDLLGNKMLHRYTIEGLADPTIVHKKITVDSGGLVHIDSQELIQYRTGIMF